MFVCLVFCLFCFCLFVCFLLVAGIVGVWFFLLFFLGVCIFTFSSFIL